jgi:hypothetical protein
MASSTWSGFFKRSRRAPDQETPDAGTEDRRDRQGGVEVAFESLEYDDGQPFIALVFLRNGVPIAPSGRVFTFELAPGTPKLEADTLASLLSRRVTHLVETQVEADAASSGP